MKAWHLIVAVIAAIILTIVVAYFVNKAKLKKAVTAGKITVDKQDYSIVKIVSSTVAPATTTTTSSAAA